MAQHTTGEPDFGDITPSGATADTLFELGMMYCIGRDVGQDYVSAHKWFNLAAMKGSEDAKTYRRELALEMTPEQVAEAQRQARSWLTLH
jgi:TPR repeat protein